MERGRERERRRMTMWISVDIHGYPWI